MTNTAMDRDNENNYASDGKKKRYAEEIKQISKENNIKIGTWNIKGLAGKEIELVEEMEKQQLDYLGITETKKKGQGVTRIAKGYWLYWSGVEQTKWGSEGVGLVISPKNIENVIKENLANSRLLRVELRLTTTESWTLIVAYGVNDNAAKVEKDSFWENLQKEIDASTSKIIILGDLNGRVGNNNKGIERYLGTHGEATRNDNGNRLLQLCIENDLVVTNSKFQHKEIHKYTREVKSRQEKSIIDYFLVRQEDMRQIEDVIVRRGPEIGSDHYLLKMIMKIEKEKPKEERRKVLKKSIRAYRLKEEETKKKYQEIIERKLSKGLEEKDVEKNWHYLKQTILEAAEESCGITKVSNQDIKKTAWWTEEIKEKVKQKKENWRKYLQTKQKEDYDKYKDKRKEVKDEVKKAKQEEWVKFGEKMRDNYKENHKLFYSTLKQLRQKRTNPLKNIRNEQGEIVTKEENIMERWRRHFEEVLEDSDEEKEESDNETEQNGMKANEGIDTEMISEIELEEAIKKIKLGKAAGKDKISSEMIKYIGEVGKEKILTLMNDIVKSRKAPKEWQTGVIVPLHKKGDSRECNNYRGITLLSIVSKVWARIWETRLKNKLEDTIDDSQCGFRKGRGVQDNIFILRQIAEKAINKGREVHICFIDLCKAFDRIRRKDIWKTLENRGINTTEIDMVKSLYNKTTNIVRTRNEESSEFVTTRGLRQGCVLSPLLFALIMDDVVKECKKVTRKYKIGRRRMEMVQISELLYADDLVLLAGSERELQYNVDTYIREMQKVNMRINIEKTKTMIVGPTERKHEITIGGKTVEQVSNFKYLGSCISSNGKIDEEINERTATGGKIFNSIKTNFLGKAEIPKDIKVEVVKKVVYPALVYGSESWPITDKQKKRITSTEMRFWRKIEGKTKLDRIRNTTYREQLKVKAVDEVVAERQLGWLGHTYRMGENRMVKQILEARPEGKNRVGRPRKTWIGGVRIAAEERGINWNTARQTAQDRKEWKKRCRKNENGEG